VWRALHDQRDGEEEAGGKQHLPRSEGERGCCKTMRPNGDDRDCPGDGSPKRHAIGEYLFPVGMESRRAIASTPSRPRPAPNRAVRDVRSRSHHAASGTTQIGVEKASTDARPGGRTVSARAASAEYTAIWRTPETATSGQSSHGGRAASFRDATSAKRHEAAMVYR